MEFPKNKAEASEMEKSMKEFDNVTSEDDHKRIIRAQLTGNEIPQDLHGKKINPIALGEERYVKMDVEDELASEGYKKNEKGIWEK